MVKSWRDSELGQSLVEMAVITPLLIFILLGLMEIGYYLRTYLIIQNLDRELARYGAREDVLLDPTNDLTPIRDRFIALSSRSNLEMSLDGDESNTSLLITFLQIDTGYPCENGEICPFDCDTAPKEWFWDMDNMTSRTDAVFGYHETSSSLFSADVIKLIEANDRFNCRAQKWRGTNYQPTVNNAVHVEMYYNHKMLFGPILLVRYNSTMRQSVEYRK